MSCWLGVGERFVVIAPTAGWGAKQWPAERYGAVAAALGRAGFRTLVNAVVGGRCVGQAGGGGERWGGDAGSLLHRADDCADAAGGVGDRGRYGAAASGGGAGEAGGRAVWADGSGAEWAVWNDGAGVAACVEQNAIIHGVAETETGLMQITAEEVVEAALELLAAAGQDKVDRCE